MQATDRPTVRPTGLPTELSRRGFLRWSSQAAAAALLAGCTAPVHAASRYTDLTASRPGQHPALAAPLGPASPLPEPTLEMKIGQMLMLGFRGTALDERNTIVKNIRDQHIGSVVLFDVDVSQGYGRRNIQSPAQLRALTDSLQSLAHFPLLICTDQEGGKVSRLSERYGFPATLSHAQLGALNDLEATRSQAAAMAQTLASAGINLNLAPVVDVKVNPFNPIIARLERSFSDDAEQVAAQAVAFVDGHHENGIRCTLKHFPGHGSSRRDTHYGFVDVTETWYEAELLPYRQLIEQGKADAVMTAHIFHAGLDPDLPATLSPAIIDGLLRRDLGYDGVVISDDMQMRAITDRFTLEKAFELAIQAGVDIIAVANNLTYTGSIADRFIDTVLRLLEEGVLTEARIDQSFRRIMRLKGLG